MCFCKGKIKILFEQIHFSLNSCDFIGKFALALKLAFSSIISYLSAAKANNQNIKSPSSDAFLMAFLLDLMTKSHSHENKIMPYHFSYTQQQFAVFPGGYQHHGN